MQNKISTLFVGVDIHKETHTLVGANFACEQLCELTFQNDLNGFQQALKSITETAKKNNFIPLVGLEDSSGNGLAFANFLNRFNIPVKTINPVLVVRNREYETHPEKSDSHDALGVSKVLTQRADRLPDYTLTENSEFAKNIKILVKDREEIVCEQTKLKNKLHWALQQLWGIQYKHVYQKNVFGKRALKFWNKYPCAIDFKRTTKPLIEKPEWIKKIAFSDLPSASDIEIAHVQRTITKLQMLNEHREEIEKQLEILINENYKYLTTCPGCGIVSVSGLIAYIKDINRFASESKLAKYCGIAPRKYESGKIKRDKTSMRGNANLRRIFKSISISQIGKNGCQKAKAYFRKKVKEGKSKKQALKCLMRQNVKIIYCIMKEQRPYY